MQSQTIDRRPYEDRESPGRNLGNAVPIRAYELDRRPTGFVPTSALPESWLPAAGVEKAIRAVARGGGPTKLRYDLPRGFEPLRRLIAARFADRGARVDPAQIVLTDSTTQALDLAARFLLAPKALVDDPRYFHLVQLLGVHRAKIVGAPYTREGPDVEALEAIFAEHRLLSKPGSSCGPPQAGAGAACGRPSRTVTTKR